MHKTKTRREKKTVIELSKRFGFQAELKIERIQENINIKY